MRRLIAFLFGLLILLAAAPAAAQTATPVPPTPGLGLYWLVDDNAWDGVWIREGETNHFDARWSLDDEEDISASLTITVKGTDVTVKRVDPPNQWTVESCLYTGEFQADGVTIYGTVDCIHTGGETQHLNWNATVIYESPLEITWDTRASRYRAAKDTQFDFICPPDGFFINLYGTNVYTDDSSICTTAAHVGLITASGGPVSIEILAGQDWYEASTSNGISSGPANAWRASYHFPDAEPIIREATWGTLAMHLRGHNGEQFTFNCSEPNSDLYAYGTDIYTDDSSICRAAVHAGVITTEGGIVTIEIMPGQSSYRESVRNGITSRPSGPADGSFRFV